MPAHQLVGHGFDRIRDREVSAFRLELGEKHRLEDKIAELFAERRVVVAIDRLEHLVGLLEDKRLERVDGLLAIPGTSLRRPEGSHDLDQAEELVSGRGHGESGNLVIGKSSNWVNPTITQ